MTSAYIYDHVRTPRGKGRFVLECRCLAATYGERFASWAWLLARAEHNELFHPAAAG